VDVAIVGAAMTPFGAFPDEDLRSLSSAAVTDALADAAMSVADVRMVTFGNATEGYLHGQEMVRGEVALRHLGLRGVPVINVENACASSSSAFHIACMAVLSGSADVVLVVGAERLTHPLKSKTFAALATAVDLGEHGDLAVLAGATGAPDRPADIKGSPLMELYAQKAKSFMGATGLTAEDLAQVSVKNRRHGALNPKAQYRKPITLEQVLESRLIADPLTLLMCAPIGDGAAAVVVCSTDYARRTGRPYVEVASWALTSNAANEFASAPVSRAAKQAFESAGIGPSDVGLAEVHDACAASELWLYEEIGLGDSVELIRSGATTLGGRIPVNVSGGLLSRGHPLGATGCAQIVELTDHLRGRAGDRQVPDVEYAVAQNSGGILDDGDEAVAAVTILRRARS
jgi:acetyl-CoA acetyltransferase